MSEIYHMIEDQNHFEFGYPLGTTLVRGDRAKAEEYAKKVGYRNPVIKKAILHGGQFVENENPHAQ